MSKKFLLGFATLGLFSVAQAAESSKSDSFPIAFSLDNTVSSEYIFRGQELGDLTFQPTLKGTYEGFYAAVTSYLSENAVLGDYEIDYYAGYNYAINETLSVDVGGTYYHFAGPGDTDTIEPYVGLNTSVSGVGLSLYYFYDTYIDDSTYEARATYSVPLNDSASLDFSVSGGYVTGDLAENVSVVDNYFYYGASAGASYKISPTATVRAGVAYSDLSEEVLNDGAELTVSAGLTLTF